MFYVVWLTHPSHTTRTLLIHAFSQGFIMMFGGLRGAVGLALALLVDGEAGIPDGYVNECSMNPPCSAHPGGDRCVIECSMNPPGLLISLC